MKVVESFKAGMWWSAKGDLALATIGCGSSIGFVLHQYFNIETLITRFLEFVLQPTIGASFALTRSH